MFDQAIHFSEPLRVALLKLENFQKYSDLAAAAAIWAEALASVGAAYAKRMMPLRTMAIMSNVFGVAAGLTSGSLPGLIKHVVNFPLNATRLREMRHLVSNVEKASNTDLNIEWLKPFMHPRALKAGSRIFSKGDKAREAFVIVEGRVAIPERSAVLEPGAIFGEMAFFSADGRRTPSASCASDVRLLFITYEQFEQVYFQNPEFGLYLMRLIVRRFERNQEQAPKRDIGTVTAGEGI